MSKSIRLSKKHGLNPTIKVCFFCGEDTNEIAILGKLKEDKEAPMRMVLDYQPCDKCREQFNVGVPLIECTYTNNNNRLSISEDGDGHEVYPTGRWCVITEEGAKSIFSDKAVKGQPICVEDELFKRFVPDKQEDSNDAQ